MAVRHVAMPVLVPHLHCMPFVEPARIGATVSTANAVLLMGGLHVQSCLHSVDVSGEALMPIFVSDSVASGTHVRCTSTACSNALRGVRSCLHWHAFFT